MSNVWIFDAIGGVKPGTFRHSGPNGERDFFSDDGLGNLVDPSGRVVGSIQYATGEYALLGFDQLLLKAHAPDGKVSIWPQRQKP